MKNGRFIRLVIRNFFWGIIRLPFADLMIAHKDKFNDRFRYNYACYIMKHMKRDSWTKTQVYGLNNIPKDSNYILYANHQGKYDALGILLALNQPCGMLWEKKQAKKILSKQICGLLDGEPIDLTDIKAMVTSIDNVTKRVEGGMNYLIFPEGGYADNKNTLQEFKSGCFSCALRSKKPIIPVAIYDSYKSMNGNAFGKVMTQVHFLEPIPFEEYGALRKKELAALVKERIQERMTQIENGYMSMYDKVI